MSNDPGLLASILENKGILLKICHLYCPDRHAREDLMQEIIFQLWRSGKSYDANYRFTTWMYRVALNVAISFYREGRRKRQALPLTELHLEIHEDPLESPLERDRLAWLRSCVQGLKELDRALILLYFEEKSHREIAEILGISESNVATKIGRIKERLKKCILNHQS